MKSSSFVLPRFEGSEAVEEGVLPVIREKKKTISHTIRVAELERREETKTEMSESK